MSEQIPLRLSRSQRPNRLWLKMGEARISIHNIMEVSRHEIHQMNDTTGLIWEGVAPLTYYVFKNNDTTQWFTSDERKAQFVIQLKAMWDKYVEGLIEDAI
jgi:hypothetical protein